MSRRSVSVQLAATGGEAGELARQVQAMQDVVGPGRGFTVRSPGLELSLLKAAAVPELEAEIRRQRLSRDEIQVRLIHELNLPAALGECRQLAGIVGARVVHLSFNEVPVSFPVGEGDSFVVSRYLRSVRQHFREHLPGLGHSSLGHSAPDVFALHIFSLASTVPFTAVTVREVSGKRVVVCAPRVPPFEVTPGMGPVEVQRGWDDHLRATKSSQAKG